MNIPDDCRVLAEELPEESVRKAFSAAYARRLVLISEEPRIVVFLGDERDHLILPYYYCNCRDYMVNVLARGIRGSCYHMLAYCIALAKDLLRSSVVKDDVVLSSIVAEIIKHNRSRSLRKILSLGRQ